MDIHQNARTTPWGRGEIVRRLLELRQPVASVAQAFAVCERTVRKGLRRYQTEGQDGSNPRWAPRP